jgi:pimeloyl-ACP methyl ester carboxylesterase
MDVSRHKLFGQACVGARWILTALALATLGCSTGITVRRTAGPGLLDDVRASIIESEELSPRTRQTLRRLDLEDLYEHDRRSAQARLHDLAVRSPQPDLLFALAEMSYLMARQAEQTKSACPCTHYYFCAAYAYHYLFDNRANGPNAYDPRFRLACDLYNTSLAKCIRNAQSVGLLDPRCQLRFRGSCEFALSVVHHGFPWPPSEFGPLLFCGDYTTVGLPNQYRTYGLGVSLIGTRAPSPQDEMAPGHAFYPREVSFPVTAFFRFEGTLADLGACRSGRLELFYPLAIRTVEIHGASIPLETDLTTPLAYFLSRSDLNGIEYTGFLNVDKVEKKAGIYMFEPYQPGKIPVVMVHGLLSSPLYWTPMFNDLRSNPKLREHFQFWFYLYPTGNSYLAAGADLRRSLAELRAELDPQGRDPALDQMVFVGHSMGGLVSKLLTIDSGGDFWRLVSSKPLESLVAEPQTKTELQPVFYFEHQPSVRRVVFIGTPHHGSNLSPSPPARLAARLVQLPRDMIAAVADVRRENPGLAEKQIRVPTSVDSLAPNAPCLEILAARHTPPGVHYHSIIGDITGKGEKGNDGVVTYASAHLDGVDSELVVPASHTVLHHHPRSVLEVTRILFEHLREFQGRPAGIGPLVELPPISPRP